MRDDAHCCTSKLVLSRTYNRQEAVPLCSGVVIRASPAMKLCLAQIAMRWRAPRSGVTTVMETGSPGAKIASDSLPEHHLGRIADESTGSMQVLQPTAPSHPDRCGSCGSGCSEECPCPSA